MFTAASRESPKFKAEAAAASPKSRLQPPAPAHVNPLWHQLATRVQRKLTVGAPNDPLEHEADRVADQVMRMPEPASTAPPALATIRSHTPQLRRACAACEDEDEDKKLQAKPMGAPASTLAGGTEAPPIVHDVLRSPGQPLDPATRAFFEPRIGHDFSQVRVHSGGAAEQSARDVNSKAYTVGHNIVFGAGRYGRKTHEGRRLIAHELTHTVQQSAASNLNTDVKQEQFSKGVGRLVQRDGEFDVPTLDQLYNEAVQGARQTGNWQTAAEKLNGFNREDIQARLAQLSTEEIGYMHRGAFDNLAVGPDSQLAQLTKPGTPMVSSVVPAASTAPATSYQAHPSILADAVAVLQKVYSKLSASVLDELRGRKTIIIGVAVKRDNPEVGRLVWTANGNWNDPAVAAALDTLNVTPWFPGTSRSTRGALGAPGDAEQRMLDYAEDNDFVVKAMAVSRIVCDDCNEAIHDYERDHGPILVKAVPVPPAARSSSIEETLTRLNDYSDRLQRQLDLNFGLHKSQSDLINQPSVTGFVGYWTNRLFNSDVPPLLIWNNAFISLTRAKVSLQRKDVVEAVRALVRARRAYLIAYRRYMVWENGIESAGTKTQEAIGGVAIGAVLAFVAPAVVAALFEEGIAGSIAAAEQATAETMGVIAQADATMLAAEALASEAELMAEAELEVEMMLFL